MKGVSFGSLHSYDTWGLLLSSKEIGSPEVKEKKVELEGADGDLDYTEYFGGVKYGNRKLKFEFQKGMSSADFLTLVSQIQDAIHGKKLTVVLDDDPDWYYQGRCKVSDFSHSKGIAAVNIEVDAEPYKLEKVATKATQAVTGTATIKLTGSRKPVVPTITTTAAMTIAFGTYTAAVQAGTFRLPELQLVEGQNTVTVTGTGSITFEYRKGKL